MEPVDLDSFQSITVKENLYKNKLRTKVSFLVNKNYYSIVTLLLCYAFPFVFKALYFPCYVEVSLNSKIERVFSKKTKKKRFFKWYCV